MSLKKWMKQRAEKLRQTYGYDGPPTKEDLVPDGIDRAEYELDQEAKATELEKFKARHGGKHGRRK